MDNRIENLANLISSFKKGSKIHIKKENRGKFTDYCGGKVTSECIARGKSSPNPAIRKRATFAANARKWKHAEGGNLKYTPFGIDQQNDQYSLAYKPYINSDNQSSELDEINNMIYDYKPSFPVVPVETSKAKSTTEDSTNQSNEESKIDPNSTMNKVALETENLEKSENKEDKNNDVMSSLSNNSTNKEKQNFTNQYLQKKLNITREQAAALVGIWQAESGFDLNAENLEEKAGKNSAVKSDQYGIGIGQWTNSRHDDFVKFMKGKKNTLQNQLDFAIKEILEKYPDFLKNLRSASNVKDATAYAYVQYVAANERNIRDLDDLYTRVNKIVEKYRKKHMELYGKASNGFEKRLKYALDSLK